MTKTYAQLQKEIAELEAKASKLKRAEVAGVVARMKAAIDAYGLTAQDLFGPGALPGKRGLVKAETKSRLRHRAKYADGNGNTWVGRGPRPQWLREALVAGKTLGDFEVGSKPKAGISSASRKAASKNGAAKRRKGVSRVKFKDDAGNTWTGHGKRPNWFKDALTNGMSPEDLLV